jgi:hypothetical protein
VVKAQPNAAIKNVRTERRGCEATRLVEITTRFGRRSHAVSSRSPASEAMSNAPPPPILPDAVLPTTGNAVVVKVVDALALPPAPVHVRVKTCEPAVAGVSLTVPDTPSPPLHAPLAVHAVAFVDDQVSAADVPIMTAVGLTEIVTVGAGVTGARTVRVAEACALPPAPVQFNVNTSEPAAVGVSLAVPDTGSVPLQAPLAVQALALVDDQVSAAAAPTVTEVGLTVMVTVGAGAAATVVTMTVAWALPPAPIQVSVNDCEPTV